jgi:hypothetical protein
LNKRFYVYVLRRPDNHDPFYVWKSCPFYVGKGSGNRKDIHHQEVTKYLKNKSKITHKISTIIHLWGKGLDYEAEILFDNLTEKESFLLETQLIEKYGRKENGGCLTNYTNGGEGSSGIVWTEESKEKARTKALGRQMKDSAKKKISKAQKGKVVSEETKQKISISLMGRKRPDITGPKHSNFIPIEEKERRKQEKIRIKEEKILNKKQSKLKICPICQIEYYSINKTCSKICRKELFAMEYSGVNNSFYGKKHTEETKIKISVIAKLKTKNKNSFFGKFHSEETKLKMRKPKTEEHKLKLKEGWKFKRWDKTIKGYFYDNNI